MVGSEERDTVRLGKGSLTEKEEDILEMAGEVSCPWWAQGYCCRHGRGVIVIGAAVV